MKKSFKVFMLAVMALCLAASASFAADVVSYDINLDIQVGANMETSHVKAYIGSKDGALSTDKGTEAVYVKSVNDGTSDTNGHEIHISYDVTIVEPKFSVKMTTADGVLASPIASIEIGAVSSADNLVNIGKAGAKNANSEITSWDEIPLPADGESYDLYIKTSTASESRYGTVVKLTVYAHVSKDAESVAEPFDSADITVYADGKKVDTVTFTSKDAAKSVTVSTDVTVSFDLAKVSFDLVSVDGKGKTSTDLKAAAYVFSTDIESASKDVYIYFTSGDASFEAKLTINVDSTSSATAETYLLKVSDITLTPANAVSNTAKLISADTDNYSLTLSLTNLNSTASGDWGSAGTITVSSDYLGGSFSITVSTDAKLVRVYVQNGTAWDELDTDEVSGDVITPNTVGTYKAVLSADLIASSDKTVSGDAYFAFNVIIASVDASSEGDETQTVSPEDAPTSTDANGNKVLDANSAPVENRFSNGINASSALINQFFTTATALPVLDDDEITALLESIGYTADDLGDETDGYKAVAFELPYTLVAGQPYFALLTDNDNGTGTKTYLGFGYIPEKLGGTKTMVILFKLLRNPNNPKEFMSFPAGKYFVGATNDGTSSASNNTRALFMTAKGETFNIKSNEAKLLQGQTTSGTAEPYEESSGDDDNQETSSHGSSSGCDAGFGALALLAVAGALVARKVRK